MLFSIPIAIPIPTPIRLDKFCVFAEPVFPTWITPAKRGGKTDLMTALKPKNILYLMCDSLRWNALGCYGNPIVRTPNIDALAREGLVFERAYCAQPLCVPARGAMFSGVYPHTSGTSTNFQPLLACYTPLPRLLNGAGLYTAAIGKMHTIPARAEWPGFQYRMLTEEGRLIHEDDYRKYLNAHGYEHIDIYSLMPMAKDYRDLMDRKFGCGISPVPEEHYNTTWIADETIRFLRNHGPRGPFFAWVGFVRPHNPFTPPQEFADLYDPKAMPPPLLPREGTPLPEAYRRRVNQARASGYYENGCALSRAYYYALVTLVDKAVGRIVGTLKEEGLDKDTLIVFSSDHGDCHGDYGCLFKGAFAHDALTRIPLIVNGPGHVPRGREEESLVSQLDLLPTFCDLSGARIPEYAQGRSLAPFLAGESPADWRTEYGMDIGPGRDPAKAYIWRDFKYTFRARPEDEELYNMADDRDELDNLAQDPAHRDTIRAMRDKTLQWMTETTPTLPRAEGGEGDVYWFPPKGARYPGESFL